MAFWLTFGKQLNISLVANDELKSLTRKLEKFKKMTTEITNEFVAKMKSLHGELKKNATILDKNATISDKDATIRDLELEVIELKAQLKASPAKSSSSKESSTLAVVNAEAVTKPFREGSA